MWDGAGPVISKSIHSFVSIDFAFEPCTNKQQKSNLLQEESSLRSLLTLHHSKETARRAAVWKECEEQIRLAKPETESLIMDAAGFFLITPAFRVHSRGSKEPSATESVSLLPACTAHLHSASRFTKPSPADRYHVRCDLYIRACWYSRRETQSCSILLSSQLCSFSALLSVCLLRVSLKMSRTADTQTSSCERNLCLHCGHPLYVYV